jgi:D-arabinose 1-dehydrogenase-like Zn-dependent alcohol dehydrogenase
MRVAQIPKAGADFEIIEREIPKPGPGHVRIRVQACGVCHSDVLAKEGGWPGLAYPRVPGHEVAGVIDEVGPGVTSWESGQRVGVGWHGGHDGTCLACRRGDFVNCANGKVTGLSYDGGYQEYMVAPAEAVARLPESLDPAEAAPLLDAGVTTFNALRHSGARPSDLVAVQGIGGLGHLGIQFAQKFGYQVAAIGRGRENAALAKKLGASVYISRDHVEVGRLTDELAGLRNQLAVGSAGEVQVKALRRVLYGLYALVSALRQRGRDLPPPPRRAARAGGRGRDVRGDGSGREEGEGTASRGPGHGAHVRRPRRTEFCGIGKWCW